MVKINLPKLRQPELPTVTSTVRDTFYRPQVRPVNPALEDLSRSLSNVVPSLRRFNILKEEQTKTEGQDQADVDFAQNKNAFKDLVKQGTIPEGANPYYINQLAKNQLKQDAREFKERLFDKWNEENVWRNDDPLVFDKFFKSFSEEFYNEKKLGSYADATVVEGFLPDANAAYNELSQRNREKRIEEIENSQKDLLSKETFSLLDDSLSIENDALDQALADVPNSSNLDEQDKRTLYTSLGLQQTLDNLVDSGMNPRVANRVVVDTVISYAELMKDEEFIDVLANIVTDKNSGARLSDTDYAFEKVNSALVRIDQDKRSDILFQQGQVDRFRKENKRKIQNNFYQWFLEDSSKISDISGFIKQQNELGIEIDSDGYNDIRALQESYIGSLNAENVVVDKQVYKDLIKDINTNPDDETLFLRLTDALKDNKIDTATFDKLYGQLQSANDAANKMYFDDALWTLNVESLGSVLDGIMQGTIDSTANELLNNAEIRLYEVAYEAIAEINADEQFNTDRKKKEEFFKIIEAEVNRLKPFLRDDLAIANEDLEGDIEAIRNPL